VVAVAHDEGGAPARWPSPGWGPLIAARTEERVARAVHRRLDPVEPTAPAPSAAALLRAGALSATVWRDLPPAKLYPAGGRRRAAPLARSAG
jgi:hypothetical protein